ncbi:MAG: hypothetical protein PHI19_03595 [Clostridia bacterium]|nr:hypothetical protein [Clostridia bacterium]
MLFTKPKKTTTVARAANSKYKKIKIAVTAVLSVVLVTVIVLAAVYIPLEVQQTNEREQAKTNIIRYTYCLAVDYRDTEGYLIPDTWMQGMKLGDFTYSSDRPEIATVDGDGRLRATEGAEKGSKATVTYRFDGKTACIIDVRLVEADGYVTTAEELSQLNDSNGTYLQTDDIILRQNMQISDFKGRFYGNHHFISGHDIGVAGGLFDTARSANFYGIVLTNVKGTMQATQDREYGALINKGYYCKIEYSSVEGNFRIQGAEGNISVGGLAGYLIGTERRTIEDINLDYVNACTTNLTIEFEGEGSPKIGGLVGVSDDVAIFNSTVRGTITVAANAAAVGKMYIGGFAGSLEKHYKTSAYSVPYLDSSYNLISEMDIDIDLTGGGQAINSVYAGGIFGSVINHSVQDVKCTGGLSVTGGAADLFIGGVAAIAQNKMSIVMTTGSIRLYVESVEVLSSITIDAMGRLEAGGLVGRGIKIDIQDTVSTVTPEIIGDRGNIKTMVSDTVGFTDNE